MADYVPKQWKDRAVEKPRTYTMQDNGDGTVTLDQEPGTVYEAGTPVNAGNMNHIEQGIAAALPKSGGNVTGVLTVGGNLGLGDNRIYSSLLIGAFGHKMGREASDGSLHIGGGQSHVEIDNTMLKINGNEAWHTGLLKYEDGVLKVNVGGTWTPVGGIKKVQRGTIVIPNTGGGATASINPVNPDKTFITFPTIVTETGESMGGTNITARLTSPTTVSFSSGPFIGATASYEVVESY